jgi:hypothetical protein
VVFSQGGIDVLQGPRVQAPKAAAALAVSGLEGTPPPPQATIPARLPPCWAAACLRATRQHQIGRLMINFWRISHHQLSDQLLRII